MSYESFDVVKFDHDPSLKVKQGSSVFKGPITLLILALEVSNVKPTYRISGPANLLMRSNWTSDPSLKVKLGSSIFNGPISRLILVLEVSNVLVVYRKSCPVNLLMWSNLTFDPSFKVKLGSTILNLPKPWKYYS